jgi:ribose transport system permease protein
MLRVAGVVALLVSLYVLLFFKGGITQSNLIDVFNRQGFLGIITVGVAVLIITGGIDLSIGSVVGASAVGFGVLISNGVHPILAFLTAIAFGALAGLIHGLLVTKLKLQAFLVTLCGMFVYRGIARVLSERTVGLTGIGEANPAAKAFLDSLRSGLIGFNSNGMLTAPMMFIGLIVLVAVIATVLHATIIGRYWFAIGYNEAAARYAGLSTDRLRIVAFVLCSTLAAFAGILLLFDGGSVSPTDAGKDLELYAITGAVLGGCSLRGGEGTALGILFGAMVMPLLRNVLNLYQIPNGIEPAVIGVTLLCGALVDELIRRRAKR